MSADGIQLVWSALLIVAGFIVSWYHKEQIIKRIKDAPPLTFDVQIVIDRTGKVPPQVSVVQKGE